MPLELPNEMWLKILKWETSVKAWGRLQQVSRAFHAIVQTQCWTQVTKLGIEVRRDGALILKVNEEAFQLPDWELVLLSKQLRWKALNVHAVSFEIERQHLNEEPISGILFNLTSAGLKIEELVIVHTLPIWTADLLNLPLFILFVSSTSKTLKSLEFTNMGFCRFDPHLLHIFYSCDKLESLKIVAHDEGLMKSVFFAKPQLKTLKIRLSYIYCLVPALLSSGANLSDCYLEFSLLQVYLHEIQIKSLLANHPLRSIKTLTLHGPITILPPRQLFPDMEQLNLSFCKTSWEQLNMLIGGFLKRYKNSTGERACLMEVEQFLAPDGYGAHPLCLEEVVGLMEWPIVSAVEEEYTRKVVFNAAPAEKWSSFHLSFMRGRAMVKLIINRPSDGHIGIH